jgi:hypothetical protein
MATQETAAHQNLKHLAVLWARDRGYSAVATEVRLPRSAFRADVVAYQRADRRHGPDVEIGETAVFECKQARADFLKDSYATDAARRRLLELDQRRQTLERLLKLHLPSLCRGESLFADYDTVDLRGMKHKTYRRVLRDIGVWQRRLFGKTKFDKLMRYRCANLNYLVVEPGVLELHEVPAGWGLLVERGGQLVLDRRPLWQDVDRAERLRLLERIAAKAAVVISSRTVQRPRMTEPIVNAMMSASASSSFFSKTVHDGPRS